MLCLASVVCAGWLEDLRSPKGLEVGNGLTFQVVDSGDLLVSPINRYSLRVDYSGFGLSLGRNPKKDAFEIGVYSKDQTEGKVEAAT